MPIDHQDLAEALERLLRPSMAGPEQRVKLIRDHLDGAAEHGARLAAAAARTKAFFDAGQALREVDASVLSLPEESCFVMAAEIVENLK